MKLKKITIKNYKNLNFVDCKLPDSSIIAFIGNNGSGKSNMLENILNTFYLAHKLTNSINEISSIPYIFNYLYSIDENEHQIEFQGKNFFYYKNGKKNIKQLKNALPKAIFTYYAGETKRLNAYSDFMKQEYYDFLKKQSSDIAELKFVTTFSLKDFPLAFFASYVFDTPEFAKIKNLLHFDSIDKNRILLHFKKPEWASESEDVKSIWGARGFNRFFFDKLIQEDEEYGTGPFVDFKVDNDSITLAVGHSNLFNTLAETPMELYTKLKAMSDSDFLRDMTIYVRHNDDMFDISQFSEGEKQLANLLLLIGLTKEYKTLFLLDEFDAYLHPNWQRTFIRMISEIDIRGQIIFTTHSPATISGLRQESVFIMKKGQVYPANSETYNRALDEIMEEQMGISMRPEKFTEWENNFRNAVIHQNKEAAITALNQIKTIVGEDDPFFITARIALNHMGWDN